MNSYAEFLCIFLALLAPIINCSSARSFPDNSAPAFFIFGDSTVDPGNNNYINTVPDMRADTKPYGQNGFFKEPTGRFSDGRVIVDFIAEYAKLPIIPPFHQPSIDYSNGVNFASGGAGVLSETNQGLVIDLPTQLRNFEKVQNSLTEKLGEAGARKLIAEAVYFISVGSNDYMGGYLANPKLQEKYNPEGFVEMVIGNLTESIQVLYAKGARKFGFLSLCSLGCLPSMRLANQKAGKSDCFEAASALASAHNTALRAVLKSFEHLLKDFRYCNSDFFSWLNYRIKNPLRYGFKEGVDACCGSGKYRGMVTCGGAGKATGFELCDNADDYVWWDSFHPTERIHEQFAKVLWNGPRPSVGPYSLKDLFNMEKFIIADLVDDPEGERY